MTATPQYLTTDGEWLVWTGPFATKDLAKGAGMRWNPGRKRWETKFPDAAIRLVDYADEAARERLQGGIKAIEASRATDAAFELPVPAGLELMPFQRAGVAAAVGILGSGRGVLLADEMGLGKTVQALVAANATGARAVLVVCPASLRLNWLREAERWLVRRPVPFVVTSGADTIPPVAELVIVNDDLAWRDGIHEQLMARRWDLLVVDEAHRLKNEKAKRTRGVLGARGRRKTDSDTPGLVDQADRVMLLTGTPLLNRPVEMWPLVHAIDPATWTSFWAFAKRYCNAHQGQWGWDLTGSSNLGELQDRLRAGGMIRRLKADVLTDLPAKRRQVLALPANGLRPLVERELAAYECHQETLRDLTAEVELAHAAGDAERYAKAVKTLRERTGAVFAEMSRIRQELGVAKAPKVVEHLLETLEEVPKVVVFAHHKAVIAALRDALTEAGIGVVSLTGSTPLNERQAAVDAFQANPTVRVFLGNIQAAGVGITLTAASHVVFAELDWVPANLTQAEDRCHRIGQRDSVLVQHVVLDESLDARMAREVVAKQAVADEALDREPTAPAWTPDDDPANADWPKANRRPKAHPPASEDERAAAHEALRYLAAFDADRARTINAAGFSKVDTRIGHELAERTNLTDGQVWLAKKVLRKYRRTQLPVELAARLYGGTE